MLSDMVESKNKVFLIVTILTHLRVMMDVADLLRSSGQYDPVIIYYPSAVFDQNHDGCQNASHDAWVYIEGRFLSKAAYLRGDWRMAPTQWLPNKGLSQWLPNKGLSNKGLYRWLVKKLPFLPSPSTLVAKVRMAISKVVAILRFIAGAYCILRSAFYGFAQLIRSKPALDENDKTYVNRDWLQRFLLRVFAMEWASFSGQGGANEVGFRQRLIRLFSEGLFSGLGDQKNFLQGFNDLVSAESPSLIVLPEENLFYNSQFIVRSAHSCAIPVAVVPFTIVNTLEWAEAFFDVDLYQADRGWNRLLARAFPRWILEHRGRHLILPPLYILGCEYFGMVPANPWLINSGHADAIAAESQFMSDYYQRAGIQKEKIHLTGALSDDKLYSILQGRAAHRTALGLRLGIQIEEKVILVGLPPDQFGAGKRKGSEFDSYEELIRFMIETIVSLRDNETTVLINLHPRIDRAAVAWLETLDVIIVPEPIEALVPLADVYLAVASATIRLGISCGIPVINFDAYQYDYDDYKGLSGVCEVKSKFDYENVVRALIHDQAFYSKIKVAQQNTADSLCVLDGKTGERMLALFNRLMALA